MKTETLYAADDMALRLARWGEGERNLVLAHGLAEHAGRYSHVGEAFAAAGWNVALVEFRGHGHSGGKRGHVEHYSEYHQDLAAAAKALGESYVVVAHSMGGLVTMDALMAGELPGAAAVACSNPFMANKFDPPAVKLLAVKLLNRWLPRLSLDPETPIDLLTRDKAVVEAYAKDPLVFKAITPRWVTQSWAAQARVHRGAEAQTVPLLMMLGDADGIADPAPSEAVAQAWGGPTTIKHYPDHYHELFNEPTKQAVLADVLSWLESLETP